ncbi:MAG: glutathione S-transferase N-terminal domain-containing protein [Pseudomonadota bacterium]
MSRSNDVLIYATDLCVLCTRVKIALNRLGVGFHCQTPVDGSPNTTGYQAVVPSGSIPAVRIDAFVLHDAESIIQYFETISGQRLVRLGDAKDRAQEDAVVRFHDRVIVPVLADFRLAIRNHKVDRHAVNLVSDRFFDAFFRLERLVAQNSALSSNDAIRIQMAIPVTVYQVQQLLGDFNKSLELPDIVKTVLKRANTNGIGLREVEANQRGVYEWLQQVRPLKMVSGQSSGLH